MSESQPDMICLGLKKFIFGLDPLCVEVMLCFVVQNPLQGSMGPQPVSPKRACRVVGSRFAHFNRGSWRQLAGLLFIAFLILASV